MEEATFPKRSQCANLTYCDMQMLYPPLFYMANKKNARATFRAYPGVNVLFHVRLHFLSSLGLFAIDALKHNHALDNHPYLQKNCGQSYEE